MPWDSSSPSATYIEIPNDLEHMYIWRDNKQWNFLQIDHTQVTLVSLLIFS